MPLDPRLLADVAAWLTKAGQDLRAAAVDLDADPPLVPDALFHCQQAVEKSLKALLSFNDRACRRTHDLAQLGQECVQVDATLEALCRRAERLTVYAWLFRYPGEAEEPPRDEAEEALALAREVYRAVTARVAAPEE